MRFGIAAANPAQAAQTSAIRSHSPGSRTEPVRVMAPISRKTVATLIRQPGRMPWNLSPMRLPRMMPITMPVPPTPPARPEAAS